MDFETLLRSPEMEEKKRIYLEQLKVTPEEVQRIMNIEQRSEEWLQARKGRMTASNYGAAANHNKYCSPRTLLKQLLWKSFTGNAATEYGTKNEPVASDVYERFMRKYLDSNGKSDVSFKVSYPGLIICEKHPWIACSPDGLPLEGSLRFLLEIKCPFRGKIYPHIPHYYFDQIQGIMGLLQLPFCDFVVWTPTQTSIRRYAFDKKYWCKVLFPRLKTFYMDEYLPRLLLKEEGVLKEDELEPAMHIDLEDVSIPILVPDPDPRSSISSSMFIGFSNSVKEPLSSRPTKKQK